MGGTFAALANSQFRVLWTGTFLAFIAFFMSTAVQSVVAFDLAGNNRAVGFVIFAQGVAQLALGPFGGALADRLAKKTVVLTCQVVITATFLAMALLLVSGHMTIGFLAAGSFLIGSAFSFLGPARQGMTVEIVGPRLRGNAIALSQVAMNASRILGPFLAAAFLAAGFLAAEGAFFGMMALYVAALVCTWAVPAGPRGAGARRSVFADVVDGVRYVARTPGVRMLLPSYILLIMFGFPYISVLPGLLENELGRDASDITILLMANAVGGLAASLARGPGPSTRRRQWYLARRCWRRGWRRTSGC
jgi:MFS family permease